MSKLSLLLDSGAFSAFTKSSSVDLETYTQFALQNSEHICKTVNLDVINPQNPEEAAKAGRDNFLYMRDKGVDPLPVFHARESLKWLDLMLMDTDYVGLSATSLVSPVEDRAWHRLIWSYISDRTGKPIVKTHSFGNITEYALLLWPWHSADAATWIIAGGRAGRIRINGKSIQFRTNKINDPNFISIHDTGVKRETWEMEIRELGLDPEILIKIQTKGSGLAMLRSFLVASDLLKLQEQTKQIVKYSNPNSLLVNKKQERGGLQIERPTKLFFVISPSAYQLNFPVLYALGIKYLLVSYFYIATGTKNFWEEKMIPFICDPKDFLERDEKGKKFWDLLQQCLLKPKEEAVGV